MPQKKLTKKSSKKSAKKSSTRSIKDETPADAASGSPETKRPSALPLIVAISLVVVIALALVLVPKYHERRQLQQDMYNNFPFKQWDDGSWSVNVEVNGVPYTVLMHYHPTEVDTIPLSQQSVDVINALASMVSKTGKGKLYITMNPDAPGGVAIAGVELAKVLGEKFNLYNIPTKAAFSMPKEGFGTMVPVITCADAVNDTVVIYIREHNTTDLVDIPDGYPHCIVVQGTDANETIKAADRFVYGLFNVIPPNS